MINSLEALGENVFYPWHFAHVQHMLHKDAYGYIAVRTLMDKEPEAPWVAGKGNGLLGRLTAVCRP